MVKKNTEFIAALRRARKFIEQGWTQGAAARNKSDHVVSPADPSACKWCLTGALWAAVTPPWRTDGYALVSSWNDEVGRTQADALACIDNSIAALRS